MRKGISPLIATVLLIAFTIAVGGIISIWITQFTRTQVDTQNERADLASECSESQFFFSKDDISVTSAGRIGVIVTNEGQNNLSAFGVYVALTNGSLVQNNTPGGGVTSAAPLQPGQKVQLSALTESTINNKTNFSSVSVGLLTPDACAGKQYQVKLP